MSVKKQRTINSFFTSTPAKRKIENKENSIDPVKTKIVAVMKDETMEKSMRSCMVAERESIKEFPPNNFTLEAGKLERFYLFYTVCHLDNYAKHLKRLKPPPKGCVLLMRLQIQGFLTDYFTNVIENSTCETLIRSVYLCLNRLGPEYEGKELGIGESLLIKAVAAATGRNVKTVKDDVSQKGDLGLVAQNSKGKQSLFAKPRPHTIKSIFNSLQSIADFAGTSSQQKKIDMIQKMLTACQNSEPKYLIRSLEGKLRIGLAQQTILISLTHAIVKRDAEYQNARDSDKPAMLAEAVSIVKQVFSEIPSYDVMVPPLLEHGFRELSKYCQLTPGIPLKPMLAHPTKSLSDVLNRFENLPFTCEYKYDGERAQIHRLSDGKVMVYSRNSENLSDKYPDIISRISSMDIPDVNSFVLDCEAVAWDVKQQCILPFQVLSTRKRKDVTEGSIQVQVCIFAFDLLYCNGKPLVTKQFRERRELLHTKFKEIPGQFEFAKSIDSCSVEDIQLFLDASVVGKLKLIIGNCEGLMVKTLDKDSSYEPSKRSRNWLKVKKDYVNGLGDSLDLVVIGGYLGRGKRTGAYGGYLLACYDPDREEYQSICKLGTGFSDDDLAKHYQFFKDHIIDSPPSYYNVSENPNIKPDVWFEPVAVWEIKAADLSISPVHKAAIGLVDPGKGISLRFPRFIKVRDDKGPEDATGPEQVADFYNSQSLNTAELEDE